MKAHCTDSAVITSDSASDSTDGTRGPCIRYALSVDRAIGPLQERKDVLVDLNLALALARSGLGELALVTGEAGAGRIPVTSVLRVSTIIDPTTAERP